MQLKTKLKKNLLLTVVLLTIATKILEWAGQYAYSQQVLLANPLHAVIQIIFILTIAFILYTGFQYMKVKQKTYLIIPVLAYFIKEVFNFLFIYGGVLNFVTVIALVFEPLFLYGLVMTLNKYWLKIK